MKLFFANYMNLCFKGSTFRYKDSREKIETFLLVLGEYF